MGERGVVYRCTVCGEQYNIRGRVWLHLEAVHRDIQRERINDHIVEEKAPGQDEEPEPATVAESAGGTRGTTATFKALAQAGRRTAALTATGSMCLAIGLFFLIVAPGEPLDPETALQLQRLTGRSAPSSVVNLQRLTIGETFSLMGTILLAAAWRPR
jgi:hypothetical protein